MLSIIIFLEFHAFIATLVIFQYLYQQRLEKFELILKDFYDKNFCIKIEIKITKTLSSACIQIHSPRKADTN